MERLRTVALLGREAGLGVLEGCLLRHERVELVAAATHGRRPRSEDPDRGERPELARYRSICRDAGVPLEVVDRRSEGRELPFLAAYEASAPLDLLCSVGWRYVLSPEALARFAAGRINLHRGQLPGYEGERPVERMLADGCSEAVVTAHEMIAEVDAGEVLAEARLEMKRDPTIPVAAQAEDVKRALLPLYAPLLDRAIERLLQRRA